MLAERPLDELDDQNEPDEDETGDEDLDDVVVEDEDLDSEDSDEDDDDDEDEDDDGEKLGAAVSSSDDDESEEASLDQLLAKQAAQAGPEDPDEDIIALVGGDGEPVVEHIPIKAQPISDREEFVCSKCRLVKPKVQLADADRGLCRDCV